MRADVVALPYFEIGGAHANRSDNFESFCCDLAISVEGLPRSTVPYGRSGQAQGGIDSKERTPLGERLGLQSKLFDPPKTPKGKVSKFWRWVDDYATHHEVHNLGRLIVCTPWPNETAIIDSIADHNEEPSCSFRVEHWNAEVLNRFAAAHPGVVRRYFGPEWAADVAARDARQRAAALRLGIDAYLGTEVDRALAKDSSAPIDDRLRAWRDVARAYREAGYLGLARDAELKHVLLGLESKYGDRRSDALRMAATAVDELQPRRAWMIGHHLRTAGGGDLGAIQLVCDALEKPGQQTIDAAAASIAEPEPAVDRSTLLAMGLLTGELALAIHQSEGAAAVAAQILPMLHETEGSVAYARLAALLADTGLREFDDAVDLERTTGEGRVLLLARSGRRATLEGLGQLAADRYAEAEVHAVECGLEGPARSARQSISRIREWMPFDSQDAAGFFERLETDRLRYWSMTRDFGDYPDPVRTAGLVAVEVLQKHDREIPTDARVELTEALVLAVRGGFITDEIDGHRNLAGLAEREGDRSSATWHAIWGADEKRSRSMAGDDTEIDRIVEALLSPIPTIAIAACAALESCGSFVSGGQVQVFRDALHSPAPWKVGIGPSLGEARVKAMAALGPAGYNDSDWDRDAEFFEQCASVFQQGHPIEELATLASWLIRGALDDAGRERIIEVLIEASTESGPGQTAYRRQVYEVPILQLCGEIPEEEARLRERWRAATGLDLFGDDTRHALGGLQSDLDYLRGLTPNRNPGVRHGYVVRPIAFVNVRSWSPSECGEVLRSLLALGRSELDTAMTRRSALRSIAGIAPFASIAAADSDEIASGLLDVALSELGQDGESFFDNDPLLWAEALWASAVVAPQPPADDLVDALFGLLTSDDERGQSLALKAVAAFGSVIPRIPVGLLVRHPSWMVRWGAVEIASVPGRLNRRALSALAMDPDWRIRRRVVGQLGEIAASDPGFAADLRTRLTADRNSLVRWFAQAAAASSPPADGP